MSGFNGGAGRCPFPLGAKIVHTNPAPFLAGIVLLLPGSLAAFVLSEATPVSVQCGVISVVNLGVWYVCWLAIVRR